MPFPVSRLSVRTSVRAIDDRGSIVAVDRRYTITPQMRFYDQLGPQWRPYVMFGNTPNFSRPACTTDRHGFRTTFDGAGQRIELDQLSSRPGRFGLVVGGSTVFGVGASNDMFALPSILNRRSATTWLNFGCRAHNSTQEWLNVVMHDEVLRRVDQIVLITGSNTLELALIEGEQDDVYPPFFGQRDLFAPQSPTGGQSAIRRWGRSLRPANDSFDDIEAFQFSRKRVEPAGLLNATRLLATFRHSISMWATLAAAHEIDLTFVLQPLATWIPKELTAEEIELFEILDNHPANHWAPLAKLARDLGPALRAGLRQICADRGIAFFDLNDHLADNRWLFVDRVHMTDEGYSEIALLLQTAQIVDRSPAEG
jgi:hypothetical protein